jgi:hypothetical protein
MTNSEETIAEALRWYIDDRNVCAREQRKHGAEEDAREQEQAAEDAAQVLSSLEAEGEGMELVNQGPAPMISPDGDLELEVSCKQYGDHIVIKTEDKRQITIDVDDSGQLRADFFAPDGPAGGDAETHVVLQTDDISITHNF